MIITVRRLIAVAVMLAHVTAARAEAQTHPTPPRPVAKRPSVEQPPERPLRPSTFDELATAADTAREAGRLDEAVRLYKEAVQLRPAWIEGQWYLATTYYEMDRYAEAGAAFRAVIAAQPGNGPAYGFKGLCEFQLKNLETALLDVLKGRELGLGGNHELEAAVQYHAGIIMTRLGQYELALTQLQWFPERANDSPRVIEALGLATLRLPLLPSELSPDKREMVLLAGRGSYNQGARLVAAARQPFEELARRFPDARNVHYAYGVFLLTDDPDRALDEFRAELQVTPRHARSILQIAFEYIKRSDWEAARPWAQQAVEVAPDDFTGRRALGQVLFELGDTSRAIEHLEIGVKLAPESPSLRFVLARAYQKAGRPADAERERGEFRRLQRQARSAEFGVQALGGKDGPEPK